MEFETFSKRLHCVLNVHSTFIAYHLNYKLSGELFDDEFIFHYKVFKKNAKKITKKNCNGEKSTIFIKVDTHTLFV